MIKSFVVCCKEVESLSVSTAVAEHAECLEKWKWTVADALCQMQ